MRETRLLDYTSSSTSQHFVTTEISVSPPRADPSGLVHGTWAGLTGTTAAWRVEDGSVIIIENVLTRKGVRIQLTSPITCRPLLKEIADSDGAVDVVLSCHSLNSGCTLLRIRVQVPNTSLPSEAQCEEISRLQLRTACITCMVEIDGHIVVGLGDGRCALLSFMQAPSRKVAMFPFCPSPAVKSEDHAHGENTSMVSAESGASRRSVASSMSFGLMSRLFGSPRAAGAARHPNEASTHDRDMRSAALQATAAEAGAQSGGNDAVLAIANINLGVKAVISLHESGRICAFTANDTTFEFAGDLVLPAKLSTGPVHQFLLTGLSASVIAVITADEDPRADSVRTFNIAAKIRADRSVALSCTQIAKRDGPVDRIVGACFTSDDVVVGTETGYVSGLLNVGSEIDTGTGIPVGTVWTAVDDIDKPYGLGRTLDEALSDPRVRLSSAHRFRPSAVAKALRLENSTAASHAEISAALRDLSFTEGTDEENMWRRIKARAEQHTRSEDMKIRDIALVDGVGIAIARNSSLYVLRKLFDLERKAFGQNLHLLNDKVAFASGSVASLLSSHAACQLLATQYAVENPTGDNKGKFRFMLTMAARLSDVKSGVPITDRIAMRGEEVTKQPSDVISAVASTLSILEPGPSLLKFLLSSSEMDMLAFAAEYTADRLPISAMFASGVSALAQYRKVSAHLLANPDITRRGIDRDTEVHQSPFIDDHNSRDGLLERAYAFLLTATEYCSEAHDRSEEDVICAMALAGLPNVAARQIGGVTADADEIMSGGASSVPSDASPSRNPDVDGVRENLSFWILERAVRLLESSGAPKSAAAAALEAMARAPDTERHEMMRAAAFGRFLDAGELEHALTAILNQPFTSDDCLSGSMESSSVLRDAVGLFVNAAADRGRLQWLADCMLPEPLRVLCGLALERRARAADAMQLRDLYMPDGTSGWIADDLIGDAQVGGAEEYEHLYSWHILRGDEASAAAAALEWAERLCNEGVAVIRNATAGKSALLASQMQLRLLLQWTKSKCTALSYALSAVQLQPPTRRYIARTRFSMLAQEFSNPTSGVVNPSWVSRRLLLAHGQSRCLTQMASEAISESAATPNIHYLISHGATVLAEQRQGVSWVVSYLCREPTYDNMLLCAELCAGWVEEIGDGNLLDVVRESARLASRKAVTTFGYSELDQLLKAVAATPQSMHSSRNWYLIALESALSTSSGSRATPQWLIDAAAWGTTAYSEGTIAVDRSFAGRKRADAAGVVRALLRYNRPVPAAKLLLTGLRAQSKSDEADTKRKVIYVPYAAIDATIETLAQLEEEYPEAGVFRKKLVDFASAYIKEMENAGDRDSGKYMGVSVL